MFVVKDFVRDCFVAQIRAKMCVRAEIPHLCARKRCRAKSLATNIGTIPKNMSTNFQLKRLKLNLDIVEKPENRVHKLTDSNVSRGKGDTTPRCCKLVEFLTLRLRSETSSKPNEVVCTRKRRENALGRTYAGPILAQSGAVRGAGKSVTYDSFSRIARKRRVG